MKRYIATISYYIHADDDADARIQARYQCGAINEIEDCHASIDSIVEQPFGTIGNRKVELHSEDSFKIKAGF